MYGELGYLNLIRQIIKSGRKQVGRNGTTYMSIGETLRFSLENNKQTVFSLEKIYIEYTPLPILVLRSCLTLAVFVFF